MSVSVEPCSHSGCGVVRRWHGNPPSQWSTCSVIMSACSSCATIWSEPAALVWPSWNLAGDDARSALVRIGALESTSDGFPGVPYSCELASG
jgi:hypothetical protein